MPKAPMDSFTPLSIIEILSFLTFAITRLVFGLITLKGGCGMVFNKATALHVGFAGSIWFISKYVKGHDCTAEGSEKPIFFILLSGIDYQVLKF